MDDTYENIEQYNPNNDLKIFIEFDNMTVTMLGINKFNKLQDNFRGRKTTYFSCFYNTILFCCTKKY